MAAKQKEAAAVVASLTVPVAATQAVAAQAAVEIVGAAAGAGSAAQAAEAIQGVATESLVTKHASSAVSTGDGDAVSVSSRWPQSAPERGSIAVTHEKAQEELMAFEAETCDHGRLQWLARALSTDEASEGVGRVGIVTPERHTYLDAADQSGHAHLKSVQGFRRSIFKEWESGRFRPR